MPPPDPASGPVPAPLPNAPTESEDTWATARDAARSLAAGAVVPEGLRRLAGIGFAPEDGPDLRARKGLQIVMAAASLPAIAVLALGLHRFVGPAYATSPLAYCLLTAAMLARVAWTGDQATFRWAHPLLVVLLPYALQWHLGGFESSGATMLWSMVGVAAAIMFLSQREALAAIAGFLLLVLLAPLREIGSGFAPSPVPAPVRTALFVFNVLGCSGFVFLSLSWHLTRARRERSRSERLLRNILPAAAAERLKRGETVIADQAPEATVVFADLSGFTELSARLAPEELVAILDDAFARFDAETERLGVEKIKTMGDGYMAVAGVPGSVPDHAARAADLGLAMLAAVEAMNRERGTRLSLRVGLHSGSLVAGVIGRRKFAYDLWGDTVNTASRMESHGVPGRVHATRATADRLAASHRVELRGTIEVKGKGPIETVFVTGRLMDAAAP